MTLWWKRMCNSVAHRNDCEFRPRGKWIFCGLISRSLSGKPHVSSKMNVAAKHPIEVRTIWSVFVTSIEHQSKSRNKMWVWNHLIWLASIGNRGQECEFASLNSIGLPPIIPWPQRWVILTMIQWLIISRQNVKAFSLVKNLGCYLDTGTSTFLWYLFQEIVVKIDEP